MKKIIFSLLLLNSLADNAQVRLESSYKTLSPEMLLTVDPYLMQVLYNDTFMISTCIIPKGYENNIEELIQKEEGETMPLPDGINISFNRVLSLVTIYVPNNNTMVRIQTRNKYRYLLPDKMIYVLGEIRKNSYSTSLVNN